MSEQFKQNWQIDRLTKSIQDIGWSRADLARALDCTDQVIMNWVKRECIPPKDIPKVARILNKNIEWFFSEQAEEKTFSDAFLDFLLREQGLSLEYLTRLHSEINTKYPGVQKRIGKEKFYAIVLLFARESKSNSANDSKILDRLIKIAT